MSINAVGSAMGGRRAATNDLRPRRFCAGCYGTFAVAVALRDGRRGLAAALPESLLFLHRIRRPLMAVNISG